MKDSHLKRNFFTVAWLFIISVYVKRVIKPFIQSSRFLLLSTLCKSETLPITRFVTDMTLFFFFEKQKGKGKGWKEQIRLFIIFDKSFLFKQERDDSGWEENMVILATYKKQVVFFCFFFHKHKIKSRAEWPTFQSIWLPSCGSRVRLSAGQGSPSVSSFPGQ